VLIRVSTNQPITLQVTSAAMVSYSVSQNGGPGFTGVGTFVNIPNPGVNLVQIVIPTSETNVLGELAIAPLDGGGNVLGLATHQVVNSLPGEPGELTNAERDAVAAALLGYSNGVDIGVSPAHALSALAAFCAGKLSTVGNISRFRNWDDSKDRITMTTAAGGNRPTVVFDFR
jgi:hypothetical protein